VLLLLRQQLEIKQVCTWREQAQLYFLLDYLLVYMDREEKIKVIYETIANKKRTFGCNYIIKDRD
jgi:hypothetical protein